MSKELISHQLFKLSPFTYHNHSFYSQAFEIQTHKWNNPKVMIMKCRYPIKRGRLLLRHPIFVFFIHLLFLSVFILFPFFIITLRSRVVEKFSLASSNINICVFLWFTIEFCLYVSSWFLFSKYSWTIMTYMLMNLGHRSW